MENQPQPSGGEPNSISAAREAKERVVALGIATITGIVLTRNRETQDCALRIISGIPLEVDEKFAVYLTAQPVHTEFTTGPIDPNSPYWAADPETS